MRTTEFTGEINGKIRNLVLIESSPAPSDTAQAVAEALRAMRSAGGKASWAKRLARASQQHPDPATALAQDMGRRRREGHAKKSRAGLEKPCEVQNNRTRLTLP